MKPERRYTLKETTQPTPGWSLLGAGVAGLGVTFEVDLTRRQLHGVPGGTAPLGRDFTQDEITEAVVRATESALSSMETKRGDRIHVNTTSFDLYRAAGIVC